MQWRAASIVLLTLALVAAAAPSQGQGGGIGVSPGVVGVPDAQPGQATHAAVQLQNQDPSAAAFTVKRQGASGPWASVDAGDLIAMGANTNRVLDLAITVPDDTGPGVHPGQVSFCRPKHGSTTVEECVGVLLNVTVGGEARREIAWLDATVPDTRAGDSLRANVTLRNAGNVRTDATARAEARPLAGGAVVAQGEATASFEAGQSGQLTIVLTPALPVGQYLVKVLATDPAGFTKELEAKVTADGAAPDGTLRAILNPLRVPAGEPVTITAWFESTGPLGVQSARFVGQVLKGDAVVASLGSDAQPVASGAHANLTAVWTPAKPGAYRVVGHVEYDGFHTADAEGRIEVGAGGTGWLLYAVVGAVVLAVAVTLIVVWRRRARRP